MRKILVAGASGRLGRQVVAGLLERGFAVRALLRRSGQEPAAGVEVVRGDLLDPASLERVCDGVDAVISCAGASMDLRDRRRASFEAVDFHGNRNLLECARAAGVRKFVYVSLHSADAVASTEYARGHELFVASLRASGLPATVIRPTGFFYFFGEMLAMARRGRGLVIGPGTCRTNPIHEADVAACCIDALDDDASEIEAGGPDVFTRRELAELAFEVLGKAPRILHVPPALMRGVAAVARPFNPRIAALVRFGVEVSLVDVVAPVRGTRTLRAYFEALAAGSPEVLR